MMLNVVISRKMMLLAISYRGPKKVKWDRLGRKNAARRRATYTSQVHNDRATTRTMRSGLNKKRMTNPRPRTFSKRCSPPIDPNVKSASRASPSNIFV